MIGQKQLILDGHKLLWHRERVESWLKGERIAPITVDCALTRRCTYNCVYCYGKLQENEERPLTWKVISSFLKDARDIGVKAISFVSDGESTLNPNLPEAILYGKELGLDLALGTNGYLLKERRLHEILPALTYLRFNISAADRISYSKIHGCAPRCFDKVVDTIKEAVAIKKQRNLQVTIGLQMVLLPEFSDQILPLASLGRELGVDYLVIKHCSDDEKGSLGVDYSSYIPLIPILKEAETYSTDTYSVQVKWSKILSGRNRSYKSCYGPNFILQISGSGLVAPCGMFFNRAYRRYHLGNIAEMPFRKIWESERYSQVMEFLGSNLFDARNMCGCLCLQHKVNEFLDDLKKGRAELKDPQGPPPLHVNFV